MQGMSTRVGLSEMDWDGLFALYAAVGLVGGFGAAQDHQRIEQAFRASQRVVTVWDGPVLIAAGRVLTDHVCYATIFDVGVLPGYQKRGVGRLLMETLLSGVTDLSVHLTSTFGNQEFYQRLGFRRHKTAMARYPRTSDYLE